jgi:pSer/pThr/pTyr-binding forkhead associated (FHA) protein
MKLRMVCTNLALVKSPPQLSSGASYRIGRSSRCAFVLTDLSVSRNHAEITVDDTRVLVKDLDSRNGTFVDGLRVTEAEVKPGQALRFGNAQFELITPEQLVASDREGSEVSTYIASAAPQPPSVEELSATQQRVLSALLKGKSEKAVASELKMSPHTVHNHVKEIYRRMNVGSRPELLALFVAGTKKVTKKK